MKSKRGSPYAVHVFGSNCRREVPPTPCGGRDGELIGEAPARAWFVPPSAAGSRPGSRVRLPGARHVSAPSANRLPYNLPDVVILGEPLGAWEGLARLARIETTLRSSNRPVDRNFVQVIAVWRLHQQLRSS